ncbi:MAG: hypothetical protein KC646_12190 [Candidatus Cloacimonetes bacterium]|nr:hypothetical protein [Candidatus Cloacimonadota bacterium]
MNLYFENIIHDLKNADQESLILILVKCLKLQKKWISDSHKNYELLLEISKHLNKDNRIYALAIRVRKHIEFLFPRWTSVDQKSAREFVVNILESPSSSEEEISQALFILQKIIRPVDNEYLRPLFSHKNTIVRSLTLTCYAEIPSAEDIPFLFAELFQFSPMIVSILNRLIQDGARKNFFDYFLSQVQSPDINQKIKLLEVCKRLQTSNELVQALRIFSQIPSKDFKLLLLDVLKYHSGDSMDAILQLFLNDFDIDICEKATEIKNKTSPITAVKKLPF